MTSAAVPYVGATFPNFSLPTPDGRRVELEAFRGQNNLVLVFTADTLDPGPLTRLLDGLAARTNALAEEAARVLAVVTTAAAARMADRWGFPVLIDEGGRLHQHVAPAPAVFITDRFREIYASYVLTPESPVPEANDVVSWLVFINIQCPECGAPEWPA